MELSAGPVTVARWRARARSSGDPVALESGEQLQDLDAALCGTGVPAGNGFLEHAGALLEQAEHAVGVQPVARRRLGP